MKDRSGQQLGNYILIRKLGQGGFGEVWLGEHVHLKTQAALKLLHQVQLPSDEEQKFCKEAAIIAKLEHPNIIRVLDYGIQESKSEPFLVMEYTPKGSLRQLYPRGTILSPHHILSYVNQVASALQYAHKNRVIHRDVKPENMLLHESNQIRLSDFGIAVVYGTTPSQKTMDKLGTPSYMSPEQFRGKPLFASDQYSLGIVVYEWLCGALPFQGQLVDLFHQHEKTLPPSMREKVPSLSSAIEEVVQKALAKNPEERYASVKDFARAFQEACQVEQASNGTQRPTVMSSLMSPSQIPTSNVTKRVRPSVATPPEDSSVTWNVPYRRNIFFTGREKVLILLHDTFNSQKRVAQTPALSGLGGMGKTQIAIEYVYRYHHEYRYIFWVRGDTRERMLSEFASLAFTLNLKEQQVQEQQQLIEAVGSWLRKNAQWLLIIDNIEDLRTAWTILPTTAKGHILLTTRTQTTGNIAQNIDLEKMTLKEGTLFLLRRTKIVAQDAPSQEAALTDYTSAQSIAEALDGLPLALDQAGAFIEESGCNLSNYLNHYQAKRLKLLQMRGSFDFYHPMSVKDTFTYSLEKIEKISPTAVELLRYCAFLDPDAIPEELIINGANELGPTLQPVANDPFLLDATLVILRKFSLVRRNANANTLTMHRLVQAVLQDSMNEKTRRLWVERTVRAINLALPDISDLSMWQCCQQYMPHVQKCVALIEEWKIVSSEAARLLEQRGMYLQIQAQYTQSFALFKRAADMHTQLAEEDPAARIASLIHHFRHYYHLGQFVQAEQPIWSALSLSQQTPGIDQQTIATCLEAVAYLFYQQGKYSQAEDYFLEALGMYEKYIGLQHPLVVSTFCGLGIVNLAHANYDRAERFFVDALTIWQQMPKPQHPFMCISLNGFAQLSIARGTYAQAEQYLQQERIHLEQTLQPVHPALAHNLNVWALLYLAQGKYNQAKPQPSQSLKILEQTVGLRHPIAGSTFDTLGRISYLKHEYPTAERFIQKAQNIREQALGFEHPDVLTTINNLADVYIKQGNRNCAEALYKDVLAKRERILGAEHPAVAQTLHGLAHLSYFHGNYAQAEQLYKRAIAISNKVQGKEHPDVAQSLHGLAEIYFWKRQEIDQAESYLQQAIAIYEKARLLEHPELAQILRTYANLLRYLNRKSEAIEANARVKTIRAKHIDE